MNKKIARWTAGLVTAAALLPAAILTAGSASASTLAPATAARTATTSSTAGFWFAYHTYSGTGIGILDYDECEVALIGYERQYPATQWACAGPYYDPPLATASNHYDPYYAELYLWIP
jgi:hypothetical protein